jgi:hypothetical protein
MVIPTQIIAALILLACTIGGDVEMPINTFGRKHARWKSAGVPHPRGCTLKRKRTGELGEELGYDRYWNGLYRIPRDCFEDLLNTIGDDLHKDFKKAANSGGDPIPPRMRLSMTLCYLGGGRVWDIAIMHHVSIAAFYVALWETIAAINKNVAIPGIPYDDIDELNKIAKGMKHASGGVFEHCVGAIDGLAIRIRCPRFAANPRSYFNRKGYFSMNLQAVCDANLVIRCYSLRTAGATHDSLAYDVMDLSKALEAGRLPEGYWIVGDDAYPNTEFMCTPYTGKQPNGSPKSNFCYYLSRMRCTIERAFGVFEIRFQIFQRRILQEPERAAEIVACCIRLHNICMMANYQTPLEGSSAYDAQDEVAEPAPHGVAFNNRDTKLRTSMVKLVEDLGYIRPV